MLTELDKIKRIEEKKKLGYSRNNRRLKSYSESFKEIFNFFLKCYRYKMLDFCGSTVRVEFKTGGSDGMFGFREYDNGRYKGQDCIYSIHPNILKGVIVGKKSFGLWVNEWCDGIAECNFTKEEVLKDFEKMGIKIPESLLLDFDNRLRQKKLKKFEQMIEEYLKRQK